MPEDEIAEQAEGEPSLPGIIHQTVGLVPTTNERSDAVTIYADAVQGAQLSPWTLKLTFIEHFIPEGENAEVRGRNVLNLTMPTPQLRAMADLFARLATDLEQAMAGMAERGQ